MRFSTKGPPPIRDPLQGAHGQGRLHEASICGHLIGKARTPGPPSKTIGEHGTKQRETQHNTMITFTLLLLPLSLPLLLYWYCIALLLLLLLLLHCCYWSSPLAWLLYHLAPWTEALFSRRKRYGISPTFSNFLDSTPPRAKWSARQSLLVRLMISSVLDRPNSVPDTVYPRED